MELLKYIIKNKKIIWSLVKNDLKKRVAGSFLGKIWLFFNPLITILVMWFVFSIGFRTQPVEGVPFVVWISCGMIVWMFFSESITSMTNSLNEYNFMLKQMQFRAEIIPILKIFSSTVVFIFLNIALLIVSLFYNFKINIYLFQLIYYYICLVYLITGLGLIFSSLRVFIKDISEVVGTLLQLGFWYTPIFWNLNLVSKEYRIFFEINPIYYIIQGYRDTYIYKIWFWEKPREMMVFFIISTIIFVIGKFIFTKLKQQFNDVL